MKKFVILFVALGLVFSFATPALAAGDPTLTDDETASLLYMFEEEKLARDVYNAMYTLWGHNIFLKIATSEQKHMDAVETLLVRYGVPYTVNEAGVFNDINLVDFYSSQMETGSLTLADALNAGVTIEVADIEDLEAHLVYMTPKDIIQVYTNLLKASNNHLKSFEKVLSKLDVESEEMVLLGADLFFGNDHEKGSRKVFEMKAQFQTQTQNQSQSQSQFQDQNQFQFQEQNQSQDQFQYHYQEQNQEQTQSQTGNGECSGDCNCNCGCEGACDGNGSQNGKP